jgi:hypothetical protein
MRRFIPLAVSVFLFSPALISFAQVPTIPTEIFAKVINPAFAGDYQAQTIRTTVQFVAAWPTEGYLWGAIPESAMRNKVAFRVAAPGSPLATGFGNVPPHVFIAKENSDLIFQLKPGESIILTGRTVVGEKFGMKQVIFVADSVARPPVRPK